MRRLCRLSLYSRMARSSYGITFLTTSATFESSSSRSSVLAVAVVTSSRKSSSSERSRKRTLDLRVACIALRRACRGLDDGDARAGADAGGAGGHHFAEILESPDA